MESTNPILQAHVSLLKKLSFASGNKLLLSILVVSVVLGTLAGYILAQSNKSNNGSLITSSLNAQKPKNATQDNRTFRDFAQGVIQKRPPVSGDEYAEGTHLLVRDSGTPVALTSSVVDLSLYEGKKVTVFGETQKAVKEGWLMDVGKVEEK